MHDIRLIRDDPAAFDAAMARRGAPAVAETLVALDRRRREVTTGAQTAQARRNEASKAIGAAKAQKDEATAAALMAEVATLKQRLPELEAEEARLGADLDAQLAALPNIPAADVPEGADEDDNVLVHERGQRPAFAFAVREHDTIGPALGLDFETGVAIAGARFTRRAASLDRDGPNVARRGRRVCGSSAAALCRRRVRAGPRTRARRTLGARRVVRTRRRATSSPRARVVAWRAHVGREARDRRRARERLERRARRAHRARVG